MKKILLNKNNGKTQLNKDSFLNVQFKNNRKLFPSTSINSVINEYEQYEKERKNSNIIRLTCTINPICSNILHNKVTEIIDKEGSENVISYNFVYKNWSAIRQNNPSSSDTCTYHCGDDIFNNHFFRSSTFKCVEPTTRKSYDFYNTLFDYVRNYNGETKTFYKDNDGTIDKDRTTNYLHLYTKDDVSSFKDTVSNKTIEKNGWFGFINEARLSSFKSTDVQINRPILNQRPCGFVDFYPERDLFYFSPKYNKYRKRDEYNWNYCLTYPFSSTTNIPFISEVEIDGNKYHSLKIVSLSLNDVMNSKDIKSILINSVCKHGLIENDIINVYKNKNVYFKNLVVNEIVDEYSFYATFLDGDDNFDYNYELYSFGRISNNLPCDYYVKLLTKIPNNKFKDDNITKYNFENHCGKLAYAQNIYGDEISEIIYTDDIDITNLKDNLNRPLTDIYFTIVKNNKGYKEWYNKNISSENVEFSHCFGPVFQTFELNENADKKYQGLNYCSLKTYNSSSKYSIISGLNYNILSESQNRLTDSEVLFDEDNIFYGDLVCFSISTFEEEILDTPYFRFNTVQRELGSKIYNKFAAYNCKSRIQVKNNSIEIPMSLKTEVNPFTTIYYDELISDDYDVETSSTQSAFSVSGGVDTEICDFYEGYYYQSHYQIPFKTFSKTLNSQVPKMYHPSSIKTIVGEKNALIKVKEFMYLEPNDKIKMYNYDTKQYDDLIVTEIRNRQTFVVSGSINYNTTISKNVFIKIDDTVPDYAYLVKDESFRYIWREIIENGFDNESDIEEYPFTNGAFYVNLPINFFLKRQGQELSSEGSYQDKEQNYSTIKENDYYNSTEIIC